MSKEILAGQLYRVGYTGRSSEEVATVECIMVAASADDAKTRFPYVVDLSDFDSYRIDYVAKEPGRVYVASIRTERVGESSPDAVIKRSEGSQSVWQRASIGDGRKWEVHAKTTCFAKNEKDAQRKLALRLQGGSERVQVAASEIAVHSGFATARDTSMFEHASFVRG